MRVALDHIVLNVSDVERALRFYADVIGLGVERLEEFRSGKLPFPSLRVNADTLIDLLPPEIWGGEVRERRTNMDHFCLAVDAGSWVELEQRLRAAGVEFELGPMLLSGARGNGTAVYVRDPEGNRVELRYYE